MEEPVLMVGILLFVAPKRKIASVIVVYQMSKYGNRMFWCRQFFFLHS